MIGQHCVFLCTIVFFLLMNAIGTRTEGPLCLSCRDVDSPESCTTLQQCGQYDECFIDSFISTMGSLKYNLGCRDINMCPAANTKRDLPGPFCRECCNQTGCNQEGCGYTAPAPGPQGPICMSCSHQKTPSSCSHYTQCGRGDVCVLRTVPAPNSGYMSGCEQKTTCQRERAVCTHSGFLIAGSNGNSCNVECCESDYCNRGRKATSAPTSTPTTPKPQCVTRWTPWFNRDDASGGGDQENITQTERYTFCPGGQLTRIDCTTKYGISAQLSGQVVHCDVTNGFRCDNRENPQNPCTDYKIRYYCTCPPRYDSYVG